MAQVLDPAGLKKILVVYLDEKGGMQVLTRVLREEDLTTVVTLIKDRGE